MRLFILTSLLGCLSCIKAEKLTNLESNHPPVKPQKAEVEVNYCSLPSDQISDKLRVVFAVDSSGSNVLTNCPASQGCPTDPQGMRRYPPLLDWVQSRRNIPNFNPENEKYAMYQWSGVHNVWNGDAGGGNDSETRFLPIDDFEQTVQVRVTDNGGTPYISTLETIKSQIRAEALDEKEKFENSQDPNRSLTCFDAVVVFISDGFPTDGATNDDTLRDTVKTIVDLENDSEVGSYICGVTINSAFYNSVELPVAISKLKIIAEEGRGDFFNFLGNDPIDYNKVTQVHTRRIVTEPIEMIVFNRNMVWSLDDKKYMPDLDSDGIADHIELPKCVGLQDCDNNLVRDGLEYWVSVAPRRQCKDIDCAPSGAKKFVCASPTGEKYDKDGDGLLDCEEGYVSSDINNFDTNKTGIPDSLKFRNKYIMVKNGDENSVSDLSSLDSDGDGISDYHEMKTSTPWQYHNDLRAEGFKPVKYIPLETYEDKDGSKSGVIGLKCFKYKIEDLTIATNEDELEVIIIDQRFTGGGGDKFLRIGRKRLGSDGVSGKVKFDFDDYELKTKN